MIQGIHHVALRVSDLERARRFYADLLGLPVEREQRDGEQLLRSIWLRAGAARVMLERRLAGIGDEAGSGHLVAFAVSDLEAWELRLAEAGVPIDARTAHTLYVRDPDGHRVGLSAFPGP